MNNLPYVFYSKLQFYVVYSCEIHTVAVGSYDRYEPALVNPEPAPVTPDWLREARNRTSNHFFAKLEVCFFTACLLHPHRFKRLQCFFVEARSSGSVASFCRVGCFKCYLQYPFVLQISLGQLNMFNTTCNSINVFALTRRPKSFQLIVCFHHFLY